MRKTTIAGAAITALALPAAAAAHVTLQPNEAPAGAFTRLDVRVPNERDDAATTKVSVQFPPGFASASYEPVEGWDVEVERRKLDKPLESHGEEITDEVATITWTGDGRTGIVEPGEFQDFGLSPQVPESAAGKSLTFKAVQTYENGEVVRWIGPRDAEEPAPQVRATAAEEEHGAAEDEKEESDDEEVAGAEPAAASSDDEDEDGDGNGIAIAALAVGGLGLLAGGTSLLRSRRPAS